jgi:hypothetical protein
MSDYENDEIEFDFFDETETQEATRRRRLSRRSRGGGGDQPRPPVHPASGLTPLLRLIGLLALLIFVVVVLVFWVRSCEGASKRSSYERYMGHVRTIANSSNQLGRKFTTKLTTPGIKQADLAQSVADFSQQADQQVAEARELTPPGPLRLAHSHMIEALDLRATGLSRFADALQQLGSTKDSSKAATLLAAQGRLLPASDVNWEFFFHDPAVETLQNEGVTGVAVPQSQFLTNPDLVSATSMGRLYDNFHGASTGGTPTGVHGDALVSTKALPKGTVLSTTEPTTVQASTDLAFAVTVENSGDSQEVGVAVTLTIQATPSIVKRKTIDLINPGEQKTLTFTDIGQPPFGARTNIKVEVSPVPGEKTTANNSATYPVFFSIG